MQFSWVPICNIAASSALENLGSTAAASVAEEVLAGIVKWHFSARLAKYAGELTTSGEQVNIMGCSF